MAACEPGGPRAALRALTLRIYDETGKAGVKDGGKAGGGAAGSGGSGARPLWPVSVSTAGYMLDAALCTVRTQAIF